VTATTTQTDLMANKTKTFTNAVMENLTPVAVDVMQILMWNS